MLRFILKALVNERKDIHRDGVGVWKHGDIAVAIIHPYEGNKPLQPLVLRNIVFQRVERARGRVTRRHIYGVVLQADTSLRLAVSDVFSPIVRALEQGKEIRLPWKAVPLEETFCVKCACDMSSDGPVYFECGFPCCLPCCLK